MVGVGIVVMLPMKEMEVCTIVSRSPLARVYGIYGLRYHVSRSLVLLLLNY